jgi:hypothetical protein
MPYQREFKLTVVARDAEDFRYALEAAVSYVHSRENRQQIDSQSDPWEQPVLTPYADATLSFGPVVKTPDPAPTPPPEAPSVVVHQSDFRALCQPCTLARSRNLYWLRVLQGTPPELRHRLYLVPDPNEPDSHPVCWVWHEDRAFIGRRPVKVLFAPPYDPEGYVGLYHHVIGQPVEDEDGHYAHFWDRLRTTTDAATEAPPIPRALEVQGRTMMQMAEMLERVAGAIRRGEIVRYSGGMLLDAHTGGSLRLNGDIRFFRIGDTPVDEPGDAR